MFKQGFVVLFRTSDDPSLMASPVLATDATAAGELFMAERAFASEKEGQTAVPCEIVEVLSIVDLERHRRAILELARKTGVDLVFGPAGAG